jgi:hypothetical protein
MPGCGSEREHREGDDRGQPSLLAVAEGKDADHAIGEARDPDLELERVPFGHPMPSASRSAMKM